MKAECELCGKQRVLKDGICNKCDKELDELIETAGAIIMALALVTGFHTYQSIMSGRLKIVKNEDFKEEKEK